MMNMFYVMIIIGATVFIAAVTWSRFWYWGRSRFWCWHRSRFGCRFGYWCSFGFWNWCWCWFWFWNGFEFFIFLGDVTNCNR